MKLRKEIETCLEHEVKLLKEELRRNTYSYNAGYTKVKESREYLFMTGWVEALNWILETKKEGLKL